MLPKMLIASPKVKFTVSSMPPKVKRPINEVKVDLPRPIILVVTAVLTIIKKRVVEKFLWSISVQRIYKLHYIVTALYRFNNRRIIF